MFGFKTFSFAKKLLFDHSNSSHIIINSFSSILNIEMIEILLHQINQCWENHRSAWSHRIKLICFSFIMEMPLFCFIHKHFNWINSDVVNSYYTWIRLIRYSLLESVNFGSVKLPEGCCHSFIKSISWSCKTLFVRGPHTWRKLFFKYSFIKLKCKFSIS